MQYIRVNKVNNSFTCKEVDLIVHHCCGVGVGDGKEFKLVTAAEGLVQRGPVLVVGMV